MKIRKTIPILAVALILCSALFIHISPVSADVAVTAGEPEITLQYPPPPPPPFPPPPVPPLPPAPKPYYPPCVGCPPCPESWDCYGCDCNKCYDCYDCHDCCDCCDCCTQTVIVVEKKTLVCAPLINSFSASQSCVQLCQQICLNWSTSYADTVTISPGIGSVAKSGTYVVTPTTTTTYTLTASNSTSSVTASTTVTVVPLASVSSTSISSSVVTGSTATGAGTGSILTMGIGGGDGPLNSVPLYALLIGVLVIVAAAIIFSVIRRKPAMAVAGYHTATVAGYAPWTTGTRTATEVPGTTPLDTSGLAKFVTADGRLVPIPGNGGALGRNEFRACVMPDKAGQISREHIRIYCEKGDYYIEDFNSMNGTRLNGARITGKGRFLLRDGDAIELADILNLTFKS